MIKGTKEHRIKRTTEMLARGVVILMLQQRGIDFRDMKRSALDKLARDILNDKKKAPRLKKVAGSIVDQRRRKNG